MLFVSVSENVGEYAGGDVLEWSLLGSCAVLVTRKCTWDDSKALELGRM